MSLKKTLKQILVSTSIIITIILIILFLLPSQSPKNNIVHPKGLKFAGSEKCITCHTDIHKTFTETQHFATSREATSTSIKGNFNEGENILHLNPSDYIKMTSADSGFYQTGYSHDTKRGSQRFDLVLGSGVKGQTYLSWQENKLVQLPVSYYTSENRWSTSPGNPTNQFVINRPVMAGCLNCHSTHFDVTAKMNEPPDYNKHNYILGVQCERCHGPSQNHVILKSEGSSQRDNTINPKKLNRRQQLDLCAQCHSGNRISNTAPFYFLPGDSLSSNEMSLQVIDTSAQAEVHGSQYELLAASKCFNMSDLTCSSCHNPHKNEKGNLSLYSSKCLNCHSAKAQAMLTCKLSEKSGDKINQNCIDCHMPLRASKKITFRADSKKDLSSEVARSHYIAIYPTSAKKIIDMIDNLNSSK